MFLRKRIMISMASNKCWMRQLLWISTRRGKRLWKMATTKAYTWPITLPKMG